MRLRKLKKLETRLLEPISIPVIGRCLQKKAITALAEGGSPDAVKVLAKAVTLLKDEEIKDIVLDALGKLRNQQCIDAFCQVWADTRHRDLTNLLLKKAWIAYRPINIRVITALKTKQLQVITNGGKEIVEPLLNAFQDKDSEIANRASKCAVSFTNYDAIDYICHRWAATKDKLLEQLVCKGNYVARNPIDLKVLTALKLTKLEVIRDCGKEIAEPLLKAFNDKDAEIANQARECAISLTNQEAIDYICQKWAEIRDKTLEQLICQGKYIAQQPIELRVLTALKLAKLEVIRDYGKEIVEPLLNAIQDKDSEIANRASECAISFTNPEAIDYICHLAIEQGHQVAHQIAIKAQYVPREPNQRALFYFLTEQWDKYESLDYEHSLLQKVYELGDEKLRKQIADKARQVGHVAWVEIVAGRRKGQRLEEMTDAEWETTLNVLNSNEQWEEMWRLAQKAPAIRVKQLLKDLKQIAWLPKAGEEREGFERLKNLADKCLESRLSIDGLMDYQVQRTLTPHADRVTEIIFSPDGKLLFSSSRDKTIKLWQIPDGQLQATINGNGVPIGVKISLSPDGKILASYSQDSKDKTIKLWQIPNGKPLATLTGHTDAIWGISLSPDGKILASCSYKTIRLWQMPHGKPLATLTGHTNLIWGISLSPDGKILVSYSQDKTIKLWQMPDGKLLATLTGHTELVRGISLSPDGKILASYSDDRKIKLWSSDLLWLMHLPIGKLNHQDRGLIKQALQNNKGTEEERHWLQFILALMDWHQRFDVEVEDARQLISTGEFDIEIEG